MAGSFLLQSGRFLNAPSVLSRTVLKFPFRVRTPFSLELPFEDERAPHSRHIVQSLSSTGVAHQLDLEKY
jgi:hypothetical protein